MIICLVSVSVIVSKRLYLNFEHTAYMFFPSGPTRDKRGSWTIRWTTGGCSDQSPVQRRRGGSRRRRRGTGAEWTAAHCRSSSPCGGDRGGWGRGADLEIWGQARHHAVRSRDPLHGRCRGDHKVGQLLHPERRAETVSVSAPGGEHNDAH